MKYGKFIDKFKIILYYVKGEKEKYNFWDRKVVFMARKSRNYIEASFFHIMVQGLNKEYIFDSDMDKKEYLRIIQSTKTQYNIEIVSYCIMDNHVHILVGVKKLEELSKFMHRINTLYALYYNKKYNRVGYVYRDRYKSQVIYSEKQLHTCINYIHNNPIKAGICKNPYEYEYSSFKDFDNDLKFVSNIHNEENKDIVFLEDEEQSENEIQELIKNYLIYNNLKLEELKENKENLKELIEILKDKYNISLRKIAIYLNIPRETIRILYNQVTENE